MKIIRTKLTVVYRIPGINSGGNIFVLENKKLPFDVKRVFYIVNPNPNRPRGNHAQRWNHEIVFCLKGEANVFVNDGKDTERIQLKRPDEGVLIPAKMWRDIFPLSWENIFLVLASEPYNKEDYITDIKKFRDA